MQRGGLILHGPASQGLAAGRFRAGAAQRAPRWSIFTMQMLQAQPSLKRGARKVAFFRATRRKGNMARSCVDMLRNAFSFATRRHGKNSFAAGGLMRTGPSCTTAHGPQQVAEHAAHAVDELFHMIGHDHQQQAHKEKAHADFDGKTEFHDVNLRRSAGDQSQGHFHHEQGHHDRRGDFERQHEDLAR